MDEKTKRVIERQKETFVKVAHSQAPNAIGEAAVDMHLAGVDITKEALIAALLRKAHEPTAQFLQREQHEEAARLLGWQSTPEA